MILTDVTKLRTSEIAREMSAIWADVINGFADSDDMGRMSELIEELQRRTYAAEMAAARDR